MELTETPTEHIMVQSIVNAGKRILGKPVSPKEPLSIDIVKSIVAFYLNSEPSLAELRFLFVLLVDHAGLLRADELLSVRYKDVDVSDQKMVILIPKRKNDQHREGHFSSISRSGKESCPVSITQKLLHLLPDDNDSVAPVLRRIVNKKHAKEFHKSKGISYSTLRQEFKQRLSPFVNDISKFGLHSI